LHDSAHDINGSIVAIKQRSCCDDSDFIGRIVQYKRLFNEGKVNDFLNKKRFVIFTYIAFKVIGLNLLLFSSKDATTMR
jgi:hypothetical protein